MVNDDLYLQRLSGSEHWVDAIVELVAARGVGGTQAYQPLLRRHVGIRGITQHSTPAV